MNSLGPALEGSLASFSTLCDHVIARAEACPVEVPTFQVCGLKELWGLVLSPRLGGRHEGRRVGPPPSSDAGGKHIWYITVFLLKLLTN